MNESGLKKIKKRQNEKSHLWKKTDISRIWPKTKPQETLEFKLHWRKEPIVKKSSQNW